MLAEGHNFIRTECWKDWQAENSITHKARIFLLVDLQDFFFTSRVGGTKKNKQKSSKNDQLNGHFQSFFFFLLLIYPEKQ